MAATGVRVAVVTGAAGGIGSAICGRLAHAGFRVVLTYRARKDKARALADALPGDGHLVVQAAVDDSASLTALAEKVAAHYGSLELLVNNAGITRFVAHDDLNALDDALIDQIFRVNWRGAFACVRALEALLRADGGGVVVNISSLAATTGEGSNVAYCAAKAALDSMTRSLARALAPDVRVVSVSPGLTAGRYTDKLDADWSQAQADRTPLKRLATAEDVAEAVFAVATQLTFSTGCIIPVDGGRPLS